MNGVELTLSENALRSLVAAVREEVLVELRREQPAESPWLTVAEAATWLRWPRERIYKLTAAGAIPHRKHEGRILLRRDELDAWLDEHRKGPC